MSKRRKRNLDVKYGKFQVCLNEETFEDLEVEQATTKALGRWFPFLSNVWAQVTATIITGSAIFAYQNYERILDALMKFFM